MANAFTPIDPAGAAMRGTAGALQLSQAVGGMNRENALRDFMGENAGAVAAGDPNMINALSALSPELGMRAGQNAATNQRADANLAISQERLQMVRDQTARSVAAETAAMNAAEKAQMAEQVAGLQRGLVVAETPEAFEAFRNQALAQFPDFADELSGMTFENRSSYAAMLDGVSEGLKIGKGPKPGFRPATPEEAAQYGASAGQIDESSGRFHAINPPKGMKITSDGKGGFTMTEGPGVSGEDGGKVQPSAPASMVATIDGLLNDPAFDTSTGILSPLQNIPGTPQRRFGSRVKQLDGQAFLQAFESLKGGGQITEIEGQKATQALGRLDSAQSADDYRTALTELREILVTAQSRPQGWATQQIKDANTPDVGVTEDGYRFLGGDPSVAENWQKVK